MTEKLESESSRSISGRLSVHQQSRSSQMDSPITNERLPMLHNSKSSSVCSSGPLSINSDPQDSTDLMLDENGDENATYVSTGNCGEDCLTYSTICHGVSCKTMFCDRFPKGQAVIIVLLINMLESFVVLGAFNGLQERIIGRHSNGIRLGYLFVFFQWCGGRIFYPITGLIADTWLGRYRMIKIGLCLMWLGFVIITVNESLVYHYANDNHDHTTEQYVLPITAVILLIISSATVEANIIPFGVDQIQQGASSSEMSSYFYYYYFSRIAGLLTGLTLFLLLFSTGIKLFPDFTDPDNDKEYTSYTLHAIHPLFAVLSVTVALILHFCTSQRYFKDKDYNNPLKLIVNVLYYAAMVKRRPPQYRRAFRYGEERKSRIELAKMEYDGIFTSEEVEDVKTFLRICLLIFSLSGNFLIIGMVS